MQARRSSGTLRYSTDFFLQCAPAPRVRFIRYRYSRPQHRFATLPNKEEQLDRQLLGSRESKRSTSGWLEEVRSLQCKLELMSAGSASSRAHGTWTRAAFSLPSWRILDDNVKQRSATRNVQDLMTVTSSRSARWTAADIGDQRGRTVVVTGANTGIGLETAAALAEHGARIVLACRDASKAEAAATRITRAVPGAVVEVVGLDLASLASIRQAAAQIRSRHEPVDVLINNAGLCWPPSHLQGHIDLDDLHSGSAPTGRRLPTSSPNWPT
jgi:hypothetical protein